MKSLHAFILCLIVLGASIFPAHAQSPNDQYVRTANYYLRSGPAIETPSAIASLSKYDLLVLPLEAQDYNARFFHEVRERNPDIIILAYVPTVSWNHLYWNNPIQDKLWSGIQSDWWLTDASGTRTSVWPNTSALNLNTGWAPYLAHFTKNNIMSSGYWDGIFYDEVQDSISWLGSIDVNKDGQTDSAAQADAIWTDRYEDLFSLTRALLGPDVIIMTNGSSNSRFLPHVNGRMFETFPSSESTTQRWAGMTREYIHVQNQTTSSVNVLNVNTENTGDNRNYQRVRFGMTTTLLGDGYFSFDHGTENHAQLWTYDEYDAVLGAPTSGATNTLQPAAQSYVQPGMWSREFTQGKVLVNATNTSQTLRLGGDYELIHGTQDPIVNNGRVVSRITIGPKDGRILLRPIESLFDTRYDNGAFARVFSLDGTSKRTGFFAYNPSYPGGNRIQEIDLNLDGMREVVVADKTFVSIYNSDGSLHARFAPYTEAYRSGINISIGDLENDGTIEIVTGTENGGGAHVRVFNADGVLINPGFFAYDDVFRGGVHVTIGDLNGDDVQEIITGAGVGGGPHIRVFNKHGQLINPGFFAFNPSFRGGVHVASGDVDGDGIDDVIVGTGPGPTPEARIFDRDGNEKNRFTVSNASPQTGLEVVASDLDGDGVDEIIGLSKNIFSLSSFFTGL